MVSHHSKDLWGRAKPVQPTKSNCIVQQNGTELRGYIDDWGYMWGFDWVGGKNIQFFAITWSKYSSPFSGTISLQDCRISLLSADIGHGVSSFGTHSSPAAAQGGAAVLPGIVALLAGAKAHPRRTVLRIERRPLCCGHNRPIRAPALAVKPGQ